MNFEQIHLFSSNFKLLKKFSVNKFKKKLRQMNIKNYGDLNEFWESKLTYFLKLLMPLKIGLNLLPFN